MTQDDLNTRILKLAMHRIDALEAEVSHLEVELEVERKMVQNLMEEDKDE